MAATDVSYTIALDGPIAAHRPSIFGSIAAAPAKYIRSLWVYHRTLTQLDSYTERQLQDIGADQGIKEFSRRAAGL